MGRAQDDLGIVGKLPRETLFKIADLVDENIITQGDITGIKDVLGDTNVSAGTIVTVFHNIVTRKDHPKTFMGFVDSTSNLTDKEKDTLREIMKKVHSKVDAGKITTNISANYLKVFGHVHMHRSAAAFSIATEFRPISKDGKIIRMVPSLVMDMPLYDPREGDKSVNFQMDLEDAEWFANLLNDNIEALKIEIQEMREKFGSEII